MVKIISDSTCDLSPELVARYDIDVLPLHIVLGEEDFEDGRGISPDEIYQWSDMHRQSPKTAAISIADAMSALEPYVSAGREVIVFSISSSMSSTSPMARAPGKMPSSAPTTKTTGNSRPLAECMVIITTQS